MVPSGDRTTASRLNRVIDRGLEGRHLPILLLLRATGEPPRLCERIRRRAARRIRLEPCSARLTLKRRDRLIEAVYARRAGTDWVAWCDASWRPGSKAVGTAARLSDREGRIRDSVQKHSRDGLDAVAAEALAVVLAAEWTLARSEGSLTAFTDCAALVRLWREKRQDARLDRLRAAARSLAYFRLRLIPRAHNQPAHRLAREALGRAG